MKLAEIYLCCADVEPNATFFFYECIEDLANFKYNEQLDMAFALHDHGNDEVLVFSAVRGNVHVVLLKGDNK